MTALWERDRRFGRSFGLSVVTDSWRDSSGKLWTPNTHVPLELPSMKVSNRTYVISEVTYVRDEENGTTAELLLIPPEAFAVQPIILQQTPIRELGGAANLNPPGGIKNPANPHQPPASNSPATSPLMTSIPAIP